MSQELYHWLALLFSGAVPIVGDDRSGTSELSINTPARNIPQTIIRKQDAVRAYGYHTDGIVVQSICGIVNLPAEDREGWDAAGATQQLRYR